MVAAENAALPGGKVGGVGDVVRDLPPALAEFGWRSTVITPAYGIFGRLPAAREAGELHVPFGGKSLAVRVFEIPLSADGNKHVALEHPLFSPQGPGRIYCDDGPSRPFATDAGKFALLSAAAASYVAALDPAPDVVHLHDWHAALYCALRKFDDRYSGLRSIRTVFTIHNLAMQGVRPYAGDLSSLANWFPGFIFDPDAMRDPRYPDCINAMATAIRLADRIHTVSPTYAREILEPNDPGRGFRGGEGLEADLRRCDADGRLYGILNGCNYPKPDRRRPGWRRLLDTIGSELDGWSTRAPERGELHDLARRRLAQLPARRPRNLLTSIGRLTEQKAALFLQSLPDGSVALDRILENLGNDVLIMVGSGDREMEQRMADVAGRNRNLLFLCGYSETFTELLYKAGDLFLMPSSFEPCGISQMLAMRDLQPCVVHAVGGLKDTVQDGVNGFSFTGDSPAEQAQNFVAKVAGALALKATEPDAWLAIRDAAGAARFSWRDSAARYIGELYE
jgi:starch synthase